MAEVFVAGATGFVGRYLIPKMIAMGHHLRCLVRSAERAALLQRPECEIIEGDLLQPKLWQNSLSGIETAIHLASVHTGSPRLLRRTNVEGTALFVNAVAEAGVKRFLYLSTLTASNKPQWPYGYSTWLAEQAIKRSTLDYTILRCSVIVGPGDPFLSGIIQIARKWPFVPIIGSGRTRFQPIYVGDVAHCLSKLAFESTHARKVLAVGGAEILSFTQIAEAVLETLHVDKIKVRVPHRAMRWLVRQLGYCGIQTPFSPGHFLSRDHVAPSLTGIKDSFGFTPRKLRELLAEIINDQKEFASQPLNLLL